MCRVRSWRDAFDSCPIESQTDAKGGANRAYGKVKMVDNEETESPEIAM